METLPKNNRTVITRYVLPQMLALMCNSVYFIVDGLFIGNRLGPAALAAAGVAVPAVEFMIALSMLLATGTGILISRKLGEGQPEQARATFNCSVSFTVLLSLVIAVCACIFTTPLARMMGATDTALADTTLYLRYFFWFSPFLVMSFSLSTYARNDGRPVLAMTALMIGSLSNVLLDYVFMYPLNMGIAGAALATGLGPVFSVLILLPGFIKRRGNLYLERSPIRPQILKSVFSNGMPAFVAEFSIGLVTLLYNIAIVHAGLGDDGLAVYLVIGYAALISLTAFLGAAEGVQPVAGFLAGAGETERNRSLLKVMLVFIVSVALLLYLLLFHFGQVFFAFFMPEDLHLVAFAAEKARIYFLCLIPAAVNIIMISFLQCMGRQRAAFAISVTRCIVFTSLFLWLLPKWMPENGLWWAVVWAETAALALAGILRLIHAKTNEKNRDVIVTSPFNKPVC